MARCRRCGRILKKEPWASRGIGKICERKAGIEASKQDNGDTDIIVPYDGGDIWIERQAAPTMLVPGVHMNQTHTASGVRTNVQRTIYRHSPTGFNFGYGGSGPADLALNILLMFCKPGKANHIYQQFKFEFLGEQGDRLVIPRQKILDFIQKQETPAL